MSKLIDESSQETPIGLEFRHLRLVTAIDQAGTLTRAARDLGITQSAASQQLLDLEARLGLTLFERTHRKMLPTEAGQGLLARAVPALRELAAVDSYAQQLAGGETGVLRVSADHILCFPWLPGAIRRFRRLHPGVRVHLGQQENLLPALRKKELDVGLTYPREVPPELESIPLFSDEMLAVLPPRHSLAAKQAIAVADFAGADLIYHMELHDSVLYQRYLAPRRVELGSFTCIEQPDAILAMVRSGLGITLLPRWSVAREAASGSVVTRPLRDRKGFEIHWAAVVRRERESSFEAALIESIRAEAQTRDTWV